MGIEKLSKNAQAGFSLVELMVVVAIIGILAAVAVPKVNVYVAKSRQTEAKTNLAGLHAAEKAFFSEYNVYATGFNIIGYRPEGRMRYNVGFTQVAHAHVTNYGYNTTMPGTVWNSTTTLCGGVTGANGCRMTTEGAGYALTGSALAAPYTAFTASAGTLNIGLTNPDRWTINQDKTVVNTSDGTQ